MPLNKFENIKDADKAGFYTPGILAVKYVKKKNIAASKHDAIATLFRHATDEFQYAFLNASPEATEINIDGIKMKTADCARLTHGDRVIYRLEATGAILDLIKLRDPRKLLNHPTAQLGPPPGFETFRSDNNLPEANSAAPVRMAFFSREPGKPITVMGVKLPPNSIRYAASSTGQPKLHHTVDVREKLDEIGRRYANERNQQSAESAKR